VNRARHPLLAIAAGLAMAAAVSGCVVRYINGPRLTGTCDGACQHYADCKGGVSSEVHQACLDECPAALGDRDARMAFESLSCTDTVEYVEGPARRPPGSQPPPGAAASGTR